MRVARTLPDPKNPESMVEYLARLERIVDGGIEFGTPQDPNNPTSTVRALGTGTGAHNGTLVNLSGAWYEAVLTATGRSAVTVTHNLNAHTSNPTTTANVRWLVFGIMHDGTAADATTTYAVDCWYQGGTRTADAIALAFNLVVGGTAPTINGSHPVVVTLWLQTAVR
jgi:hypothetical protein